MAAVQRMLKTLLAGGRGVTFTVKIPKRVGQLILYNIMKKIVAIFEMYDLIPNHFYGNIIPPKE